MANKGYTSKTLVESYLQTTISTSFNTQFDTWLGAIELFIDKLTGRSFKALATAAIYVFDGNGKSELLIDDCISVSKLEVDDVEIEETNDDGTKNWYLYPANVERKYKIKLVGGYFATGTQNVAVTAKWGYSAAVPADVQMAATILLAGLSNSGDPSQSKRSETIGNYSVSYDSDRGWTDFDQAIKILKGYRKLTF